MASVLVLNFKYFWVWGKGKNRKGIKQGGKNIGYYYVKLITYQKFIKN